MAGGGGNGSAPRHGDRRSRNRRRPRLSPHPRVANGRCDRGDTRYRRLRSPDRCRGRRLWARHPARAFAGHRCARGMVGGTAARLAAGLRDPCLLGGCGGRQRHGSRRIGEISCDADAGDMGRDPCRCGRGDLPGTARRSGIARHRSGEDRRLAQRRRPDAVWQAAATRSGAGGGPGAYPRRHGRLYRQLLRL